MTLLTMKNREVQSVYTALKGMGSLRGLKFAYASIRNLQTLQPHVVALEAAIQPFTVAQMKVFQEHGEPGEEGLTIITDEGRAALAAVHDEFEEMRGEYEALLEEEVEADLSIVAYEEVPEDISGEELEAIFRLVEEPVGEP